MSTTDLDVIEPPAGSVTFRGRVLRITPVKVGKLPAFARAIAPVAADLEAMANNFSSFSAADLVSLVGTGGEGLLDAVAIAAGIERAELDDADLDDLLALLPEILAANRDFFVRRLMPAILALAQKVQGAHGAGPTP